MIRYGTYRASRRGMNGETEMKPTAVWIKCGHGCQVRETRLVNENGWTYHDYRIYDGWEDKPRLVNLYDACYPCLCLIHKRLMMVKPIKAKIKPQCPCDNRCTTATGETCNCSCGGMNHGIDT